ncbi:MAG TPA: glycosyltransferase, partial [Opitutaceae bacterium]
MRVLFVHERFGALGGAEANILLTAQELKRRAHCVAIAHGPGTGDAEWLGTFKDRVEMAQPDATAGLDEALDRFQPDVVYVHKCSDPAVLDALADCARPVIRMVHDHDLYCMRSYRYNYFTRRICTRAASPYCVFPCGAFVVRGSGGFPVQWVSYRAKRREIDANKGFHRLVVATSYMREELLKNGFATDQIEIHAPVPRPCAFGESPSFSARNLIVYSGQIIRGKGVDALLESLALVETPFECWIFGDGSQKAECQRLSARLGLEGRV